jgi:hypothetical protein
MRSAIEPCRHQLIHPPHLVMDAEGNSYITFQCVICGCAIGLSLDAEGTVDREITVPPDRKSA